MIGNLFTSLLPLADTTHKVETLLFGTLEDDCHGTILLKVVVIVANFLLAGIVLAGTIGIIISGVQILTARDNATQVANGKKRILDVVIGILAFGFMYVIANFLIPGGITLDSEILSTGETCPEVAPLPTSPGDPGTPGEPGTPSEPGTGGCIGNTVEHGGYCYAKTQILAYEYQGCQKYNTCQSANEADWGSRCDAVAKAQANEMLHGYPSSKHTTLPSGSGSSYNEPAPAGEDNVAKLMCNGSLSWSTTKPGASSINRIAFKRAVKTIVTEIEAGHPITIAASNLNRGKASDAKRNNKGHRHFIVIVGYTSELNSSTVDSATIEFESGNCINSGIAGKPEPWDQPIVTVNGKQIYFQYIDAWGGNLGTLSVAGGRLWRLHYDTTGWYFYKHH